MYHEWAFGSIHYELAKYLFKYDINCKLLLWHNRYSYEEIQNLNETVDTWVSTMEGVKVLNDTYNIPIEKCIAVAHSIYETYEWQHVDYSKIKKLACISSYIKQNITLPYRYDEVQVCPLGVNFNSFYMKPSNALNTVGYGGFYSTKEDYLNETTREIQSPGIIIKRSFLAEESAKNANLNFIAAQHNITTHVTMPGFYKSIDCLIASSTALEAGGLPVLEAGAAGRLVISTPVGHWDEKVGYKGGISVPIPEQEFIDKTTEILLYYKNNQSEYNNRCEQIQEYSRRYDWSNVIEHWVKLILDN